MATIRAMPAGPPPAPIARRWAVLVVAATVLAYLPALRAGYIWDDDYYVTQNEHLRDLGGLWRIWVPGATPQYYPMVFLTFWLEYRLWALEPFGYHLTNVLLHAANALLVARLAHRLRLPWHWALAALFALHPVHVESVAWITERKNVLSTFGYLLAALAWLRFDDARTDDTPRPWRHYLVALAWFLFALLSKTVTCSLPAALILLHVWRRDRLDVRRLWPLLPMFAVGLALALHTAHLERTHVGADGADFAFSFAERTLIAGNALLFYAGKLAWPWPLMFFYPRWQLEADRVLAWWPLLLCGAVAVLVLVLFVRGRRGPAVAVAFFAGSLFPALGYFNVYPMIYSFVADHFQYLASLGVLTLVVAAFRWSARRLPLVRWLGVLLLAGLGGLTHHRCHAYTDEETLWRDTIAQNPSAWMAHNNLACLEMDRGDNGGALVRLRAALEMTRSKKERGRIARNIARVLSRLGRFQEEYEVLATAQQEAPGCEMRLARALERLRRDDEAQTWYERALGDPKQAEAPLWYGMHLLRRGRSREAIPHLERFAADAAASGRSPREAYDLLATAYRLLGRDDDARRALERAGAVQGRR